MPKVIQQKHFTGRKGVNKFEAYCLNHEPKIVWKEIPLPDIGIDGEIELLEQTTEPNKVNYKSIAEIIKVQVKSVETDKSYIRNENKKRGTFTFYAERSHVEYWQELDNEVIVAIYDGREGKDVLYVKKIQNIDLTGGSDLIPIVFHIENDVIEFGRHDFLHRFSKKYQQATSQAQEKTHEQEEEILLSNLLEFSFPDTLHIAPINYNRNIIIKKSFNSDKPLRLKASAREVALAALHQQGLRFSSDWTIFGNEIITFHNLNKDDLPLAKIIDPSVIYEVETESFYSIDIDHKNVLKTLLRFCLQQKLYKLGYEWIPRDKIFRYRAPKKIKTVKESWIGKKQAKRTVFKATKDKRRERYYCKHFAFRVTIKDFNDRWFACITPTWTFTIDGVKKSYYTPRSISNYKKQERNPAVRNHLRFIYYNLIDQDLFKASYDMLDFMTLKKFTFYKVINDKEWLASEDSSEIDSIKDQEEPQEISESDEPQLFTGTIA